MITAIQIVSMFYWVGQKSNYYIDELYSMEDAQNFPFGKKNAKDIMLSDEWKYMNWTDNSTFRERLKTSKDESLLLLPFEKVSGLMLNGYNYFGLLNIFTVLFSPDKISPYPGFLLNLIFF